MMARYVWIVEDEKYGTQAVFATKAAAQKALNADRRAGPGSTALLLSPSGYTPMLNRYLVRG